MAATNDGFAAKVREVLSEPLGLPAVFLDYLVQYQAVNPGNTYALRAPVVISTGTPGATSSSRHVGATSSGAPASGSFQVGDFVVTQNGHIFVCTVAGSPGTWVDAGGAGSLVSSVFGRSGAVVAVSGDYAVGQVTGAAPLASPVFTGDPQAPTPLTADNDTSIATTAFVKAQGYLTAAPVTSVFTRTGAVVATSGDYTAAQITNAADKSSGSQQAFTAEVRSPDYSVSGLTGATAATRYVGATASGAPASGTFAVGDHVIDQTGAIWVCTIAGTPGTWKNVGASGNLVTSVFGRAGVVVAASGDYTAAQVTNAADKSSASVQAFTGGLSSASATGGVGFATGAGGAATQITSRTTGVTVSKPCGQITLVSAAGSATWATFTVTNTTVAATDVVHVCQATGANTYNVIVSAVANGSFKISVSAVVGTATEAPVLNFAVLKSVAA